MVGFTYEELLFMGRFDILTPFYFRIILLLPILFIYPSSFSFGQSTTSNRCATTSLLSAFQTTGGLKLSSNLSNGFRLTRPSIPGEAGRTGGFGHTYLTPPTFYNSPGGHFKIWYVTTGSDRPGAGRTDPVDANNSGVPDWVEQCADFFDQSWRTVVDTLGYRGPPVDFQFHAQYVSGNLDDGGDNRYDVYVLDIGAGIAGYTAPETVTSGRQLPSYIVVDNDFVGVKNTLAEAIDLLRATAAHELFHAVQFGYDANEDIYWFEQTAVWMEEQVFDAVNDYVTYLSGFSGFLTQPWVSLDVSNGQHEFSGTLWPQFLSEQFSPTLIRTIWERAETVQSLDAMEQSLVNVGSNLKTAFQEFTTWNAFTNVRANPTLAYEEGATFPLIVPTDTTAIYPFTGPNTSASRLPSYLGANYIIFTPDATLPGGLHIDFTGLTGEWGVSIVATSITGPDTIITVPVVSQKGIADIFDWGNYDAIILVAASLNRSGSNFNYQYTVSYDSTLSNPNQITRPSLASFPNPFSLTSSTFSTIKYEIPRGGRVVLTLYNILGQEIRTLLDVSRPGGTFTTSWDGTDQSGQRVASGVYFYRMVVNSTSGSQTGASGKLIFLK
jgi:hypothetical protein